MKAKKSKCSVFDQKKSYLSHFVYILAMVCLGNIGCAQKITDHVNPFIGTSNYGATNPGAIVPRGMVSVSPFNVAGRPNMPRDKDQGWMSNPYIHENKYLTGFSHVNLSGVGCPDLGVILAMPTMGKLVTDYQEYGSNYSSESARPGYYAVVLDKYNISMEATATARVGVSKYHFPAGKANILINLGLGLTNEQGASVKIVSPTEIEGYRTVGAFCYNKPEEAYPVYFVIRVDKKSDLYGVWKKPHKTDGPEAVWMGYNGKTRIMEEYRKEVVGDSIGAYFSYEFQQPETVEMKVGVSYVSIENARENLEKETSGMDFEEVKTQASRQWENMLSRIWVEGGTPEDKIIFYTALYHTLIHPNLLNDVNGEYPKMGTRQTLHTNSNRYTVFSFWDTYRNLHQLLTLVYPDQQSDMIKSMLNIYNESGWLPKWELNATETTTMVGDPAGIVIADTYLRGVQDFDIEKAYQAMLKSATQPDDNPLRPGIREYLEKGYLTTASTKSGSVSTTQEYNISDFAIAQLAKALKKNLDYSIYSDRSISYRNLFSEEFKLLRPKNGDGSWLTPFDPLKGANFQKNVGFIEGNSWQYTFMVTHDIPGLIDLMGGSNDFVDQLENVFRKDQYDMANEPDIAYPYLFNFVRGAEWKSQQKVQELIRDYFQNKPAGLPGNDDTGTMSAWLIHAMMGIYPVIPAKPIYTITTPIFDRITISLDPKYYQNSKLIIERKGNPENPITQITLDGTKWDSFFISQQKLIEGKKLVIKTN